MRFTGTKPSPLIFMASPTSVSPRCIDLLRTVRTSVSVLIKTRSTSCFCLHNWDDGPCRSNFSLPLFVLCLIIGTDSVYHLDPWPSTLVQRLCRDVMRQLCSQNPCSAFSIHCRNHVWWSYLLNGVQCWKPSDVDILVTCSTWWQYNAYPKTIRLPYFTWYW